MSGPATRPASLDGHSVLVTGGGSGIGRAVAELFAGSGAAVTVLERSVEHGAALADTLGAAVRVVTGDALEPADLDAAVSAAMRHGGGLDTLVTNVGVHDQGAAVAGLAAETLEAAFTECFSTNVLSVLLAARAGAAPLARRRGSIVVTLSESAFRPRGGGVLYGASKWALRGVVSHLAAELAPHVRVNGVAPGGTTGTRLAGLRSLGQRTGAHERSGRDAAIRGATALEVLCRPEDHATAYTYLATARVVTGVVISSDGGG